MRIKNSLVIEGTKIDFENNLLSGEEVFPVDGQGLSSLEPIFLGPDDPKYAIMIVEPYRVEFNKPGAMIPEVWEK